MFLQLILDRANQGVNIHRAWTLKGFFAPFYKGIPKNESSFFVNGLKILALYTIVQSIVVIRNIVQLEN